MVTDLITSRIVIAASSDIGYALATHWLARGHKIAGTYRTRSDQVRELEAAGAFLVECDFAQEGSIDHAASLILANIQCWDALALLPGTMVPLESFEYCNFDLWDQSIRINFLNQMRMLHRLLPARTKFSPMGALIALCAGSGSNSAPKNLSAYTVSKVALTKMCELLDSEIPDIRSVIIGPGWVKTRIHQEMISAGATAGQGYHSTVERFRTDNFVPMESVLAFLDWLDLQPRTVIGGRNFSVPNDPWNSPTFIDKLNCDQDMYKLRRYHNEWKP